MSTRCFGVCLVSLLVISSSAMAGEDHMHAMAKMTDAQVIESASSAAPAAVGKESTIIAVNEDGTIRTVRQGSNNFTCMADNPQTPGPDPMCGDANSMVWVNAWLEHKTPAGKPGFMYMLAGGTDASNTDPYATQPTAENHWIKTGPHIMIVGGDTTGYPRTPDPDTSKPYVMWPGTPYEHLMIPVK
jgi:hypothetical protein